MRFVVFVALLATIAAAEGNGLMTQFNAFKVQYKRSYSTSVEEEMRFKAFSVNVKRAADAQATNPLATFGVNAFSDRTDDELKRLMGGVMNAPPRVVAQHDSKKKPVVAMTHEEKASAKAYSVDWRTKGAVGPVVNQGNCNWNWAISAAGNIEGVWAASGKPFVSASAQELISCVVSGSGCNYTYGSEPSVAFDWLLHRADGRIATSASFPLSLVGLPPTCPFDLGALPTAAIIKEYVNILPSEEDMAAYTFANGPISAVAYVTGFSWMTYTGGILTNCIARVFEDFNIAVLVVGYNDFNDPPYWILKNSWGSDWGEGGYIRMQKGVNLCDITETVTSAVLY